MPDFHRRQDPVCPVPSTEPAIEAQPDLRATASSQNPWYERVDLNVVQIMVSQPGLSPLPEGAERLSFMRQADVQVARLKSGEEALFIDGERINLDPARNHSPWSALRILRACGPDRELREHIDAFRSLNLPGAEQDERTIESGVPISRGRLSIMKNDEFSEGIYFDAALGSEIPHGFYVKPLDVPDARWQGPYPTQQDAWGSQRDGGARVQA